MQKRPTPRLSVLVAVAGTLLILGGLLGASAIADVPDALLILAFVVMTAGGYALVWFFRDGPLATAGATASAVGLPLLLGATLASDGSNTAVVGILTLAGWIAAYVVGPGRGHVVYIGAAVAGVGLALANSAFGSGDDPGTGALWMLLLISAVYLALGFLLDRQKMSGLATAFTGTGAVLVGLSCTVLVSVSGVLALDDVTSSNDSFGMSSTSSAGIGDSHAQVLLPGLLMMIGGVAMIRYGVAAFRRATAWVGALALMTGSFGLLYGIFGTNGTGLAISIMLVGGALIYGAWVLSSRIGEADELADAPSFAEVGLIQAVRDSLPVRSEDPALWRSFGGAAWQLPTAPPATAPGQPGPGWFVATDGRWYPSAPPTTPPAAVNVPPTNVPPAPAPSSPAPEAPVSPTPTNVPPVPPPPSPTPEAPANPPPANAPGPPPPSPGAGPTIVPAPPPPAQRAPVDDLPPGPGWRKGADGRWSPPSAGAPSDEPQG